MGSSGAGKTTLLDILAQQKTEGTIHGSILIDDAPTEEKLRYVDTIVDVLELNDLEHTLVGRQVLVFQLSNASVSPLPSNWWQSRAS